MHEGVVRDVLVGRFPIAIARNPMHLDETAANLDHPRYRYQRPLLPFTAWALHPTGGGTPLVLALLLVSFIGIAILAFLLGEPHLEGRNAHATTFEIYFKDPFLAYVYLGSTPFFIALYRAVGLLGHVRKTGTFSQGSVDALRAIQRCALVLSGAQVNKEAVRRGDMPACRRSLRNAIRNNPWWLRHWPRIRARR